MNDLLAVCAASNHSCSFFIWWRNAEISLPGSDSLRGGLMFYCRCLFFISPRYLQAPLANHGEILHDD